MDEFETLNGHMSLRNLASIIGCTEQAIRYHVKTGELTPYKIGRSLLFNPEEIDRAKTLVTSTGIRRPRLSLPTEEGDKPLSAHERKHFERLAKADESRVEALRLKALQVRFQCPDGTKADLEKRDAIRRERVQYRALKERYPHIKAEGK